jgi:hypothetical protein
LRRIRVVSSPAKPRIPSPRKRAAVVGSVAVPAPANTIGADAPVSSVGADTSRPPAVPRVLVFDLHGERGLSLATGLRRSRDELIISVTSARALGPDAAGDAIDVALVSLSDERFDGLAFGAELGATFPWIEIVYWFDEGGAAPFAAAAKSLGVRRMIPLARLLGWLDDALPTLTRMARARREHLSAERQLPPLPAHEGSDGDLAGPLPQAERLFREAYLRQLLSRSESRTIAARRAGVPYTTFCSMLKKAGL